jgi:hypothetical protein
VATLCKNWRLLETDVLQALQNPAKDIIFHVPVTFRLQSAPIVRLTQSF